VYDVSWSHNGTHLITSSSDKTVTIWDPKAGKILRILKGHKDTVKRCVFSPVQQENGICVAASAGGYDTILWNPLAPTGNMVEELRQHEPGKEVECVDISSSGKLMATGGRDGKIQVSTVPYVSKLVGGGPVDAKATTNQRWDPGAEKEDWQDAVRRRKEQSSANPKPIGSSSVQQTQILGGLDRVPEGEGGRFQKRGSIKAAPAEKPWQKRQREAEESRAKQKEQVPANRVTATDAAAPKHPMVSKLGMQRDRASPSPTPAPSKITDLSAFMSGLKQRTDDSAEVIKDAPARVVSTPTKKTKEDEVEELMGQPVLVGKKVRLRKFSITDSATLDAAGGESADASKPAGDAFANY
jgi:hypothetical protein